MRPFALLASAMIDDKGRFTDVHIKPYTNMVTQMSRLDAAFPDHTKLVHPVGWTVVELNNPDAIQASVLRWERYTTELKGEGFIYRPAIPTALPNGLPVQPAMKVRGREYLRIIYGHDYLEPASFERLKRRRVAPKRAQALFQHALSMRMLTAFFNNAGTGHARALAAFLGAENGSNIDRTL